MRCSQCIVMLVAVAQSLYAGDALADQDNSPISQGIPVCTGINSLHMGNVLLRVGRDLHLRSFDDAFACIRALASRPEEVETIEVLVAAGTYQLAEPIILDPATVGNSARRLRFVADGGLVRLTGATAASSITRLENDPVADRLPAAARGAVWVATWASDAGLPPVDIGPRGFFEGEDAETSDLLVDDQPYRLARWPNDRYLRVANVTASEPTPAFQLAGEELPEIAAADVWAHGFWRWDWADEYIQVSHLTPPSGTVELTGQPKKYGLAAGARFYLLNAPEMLDQPGEWYFDRSNSRAFFWPKGDGKPSTVEITSAPSIVQVTNLFDVEFDGFLFDGARGIGIVARDVRRFEIRNSVVRNVGGVGVVIEGSDSGVRDSVIEHTGSMGVVLRGGSRQNLTPGALFVTDSVVRRFGRWKWSSVPGIRVEGVGNLVEGNTVEDGPHAGIFYFGNDHLIKGNVVRRVARQTDDVGAIYTGRDWTGQGSMVVENTIYDVHGNGRHGASAIYLDDQASGITVTGNTIYDVDRGVLIGGGRDNRVVDNSIRDARICIALDARGLTWQKATTDDPAGVFRRALAQVPFAEEPYLSRYPQLQGILADDPGEPKRNLIEGNRTAGCRWAIDRAVPEADRPKLGRTGDEDGSDLPADHTGLTAPDPRLGPRDANAPPAGRASRAVSRSPSASGTGN